MVFSNKPRSPASASRMYLALVPSLIYGASLAPFPFWGNYVWSQLCLLFSPFYTFLSWLKDMSSLYHLLSNHSSTSLEGEKEPLKLYGRPFHWLSMSGLMEWMNTHMLREERRYREFSLEQSSCGVLVWIDNIYY